jgi:hypothetical protein
MLFLELIELLFNIGDLFNYFEEKKKKKEVRSGSSYRNKKREVAAGLC